jgi:hypothetical protein
MVDPPRPAAHAAAGGALGLCVGVLMGMTTTPVVGAVIGALTALLATLFGTRTIADANAPPTVDSTAFVRVGSFGALCVVGVLIGIGIRAHNLLGMSLRDQTGSWISAGFDSVTARNLVALRELGVMPDSSGRLVASARPPGVNPLESVLSSGTQTSACRPMDPRNFGNDAAKIVESYSVAGGGWAELATALKALPHTQQLAVATAAWHAACPGQ